MELDGGMKLESNNDGSSRYVKACSLHKKLAMVCLPEHSDPHRAIIMGVSGRV